MPGTRYAKLQMTWFSLLACSGSGCGDRPKPTKWKVLYFLIKFQRHTQQFQQFSRFLSHLQESLCCFFFYFCVFYFLLWKFSNPHKPSTSHCPCFISPLPHPHNSFFPEFFKVNSGHKCQFTRKHIRMDI